MLLAHGVGTRADLPIPLGFAIVGAGLAVVISFAGLAVLWPQARLAGPAAGRPLPAPVTRFLDSPPLRALLRVGAALVAVEVVVAGWVGPPGVSHNIAPWALYVTFWVGLVPASLLLGPVWRIVNPLRLVHALLARLLRLDPDRRRPIPVWVGYRPAALSLAAYAWLELVAPARGDPRVVAGFLTGYALVHTAAALVFGPRWFDRGDGFEVYSSLLGALAPLGRRPDGRLVLRSPLDGLAAVAPAPGLVAVVVVLVGSTAFDGLSRSTAWQAAAAPGPAVASVGLAGSILLIGALYLAGTRRAEYRSSPERPSLPVAFAHTIVPIAAGYAIAHYFSLLVFDGQQAFVLASDPFGAGWDLFGTASRAIDYGLVGTTTIALVQLSAIVAGHLVAVVTAHDRAVRLFPRGIAVTVHYPLLAAMVLLTVGAVGLVFAP